MPTGTPSDLSSQETLSPRETLSPQELAERTAEVMYAADAASQALGMVVEAVGPGHARLTMQVRPDMLNGHGTCHGGMIFTLADSAFAFGCNSYNHVTVAQACDITYLAPARPGDTLTADCREQARAGRSGVYDITVTNQNGTMIALFRGKSRQVSGEVVAGVVSAGG